MTTYADYKAAQEADAAAWMEAHAADLYEPRRNDDREILECDYSEQYFDFDSLASVDYDDLDYYTKMGVYAARSRRGRIEYRDWTGDLTPSPRHHKDVDTVHGSMSVSSPDMMIEPAHRIVREVLPFRGVPVRVFKGPAIAPTSYQAAIKAEAAPKKPRANKMSRLRAKADRRAK